MPAIVRTVLGDIDPERLGTTLPHEHVIQDHFPIWGDPDETLTDADEMARELALAKDKGIRALADLSTIDTNHDLDALKRVSLGSGVHIVGSTGWFYGQHVPAFVRDGDVEQLADVMHQDVMERETRAGVIGEIGWSENEMLEPEGKVFEAAAIVHRRTGVPIFTHTTGGTLAAQQVDFLVERGVDPSRIAVSHMDTNPSFEYQLAVAQRGAYLSFDRVGNPDQLPDDVRLDLLVRLVEAGYVRQVLLSHDTARRSQLECHGGRGYADVLTRFLPRLRALGVGDENIRIITDVNPRAFFAFSPTRS